MHLIQHSKLVHWIAALAIWLGALAPAVSQALSLASNGQGFVVEICSTNGTKMTQVIGDDEPSSSSAMGSHCPYCLVQPIYLLPSFSTFQFVTPLGYTVQAKFSYQAPQRLSAWIRLPSRAPPTAS
ncbi:MULTISPECIES: DUF2946 domain-containing protein [unclassified Polynucleobacter]|jgi:hypothetical protein|uniref:DUF2946 domain-containing protein n=1 Tax=unclassified Polynucleobacter TaxID=2640945 RepID=UPI000BC656B4|nr:MULTISPECIES: DUF2946 domain-containing protein [unclassified Polynucleobacter]OYY10376.1 MAG: hypothetical protein B7Y67_15095 [Polynucleobacter sp. 35-46-11]OZA73658.1 MAG: hypothetical protein B7X71_15040 [Polynucleobacter sp. 39-46-10]